MTTPQPPAESVVPQTDPKLTPTPVDALGPKLEDRPVTQAELATAIEQGFRRAQQSAKSRTQAIENQVQALTKRISDLGTEVTPEMTEKLRTQVTADLETQEQQRAQEPGADDAPGSGNPVYDWTMAFYREEGMDVKATDPEWKQIKLALDDPNGNMIRYQRAVIAAINQKRARTASESETAAARVIGSGGPSSGEPGTNSALSLWERAYTK